MAVWIEATLAAVDVDIATYWQDIVDLEADYLVANGKYAQGLSTHDTLPADGNATAPDNLADSPTDQAEDWNDLVTLPNTMDCALILDVYQTASEWGWVAIFELTLDDVIWRKMVDMGPLGRDRDWYPDIGDAQDVLEISALACWSMDETSGVRYDSISTNHLSDYNTVGYNPVGVVDGAATFDPDSEEYLQASTSLFANDIDFTITGWFLIDDTVYGNKNQKIMQLLENTSEKGKIEWAQGTPNTIKAKLFNKEEDEITSQLAPLPNRWHFIEYYYDSANSVVGGSLNNGDRFEESGVSFDEDTIDKIKFGAIKTGSDPIVHLDRWCMFDKLLTRTELSYLYNSRGVLPTSSANITTDLLAAWHMDEASGTRYDSIGSYDLTDINTCTQDANGVVGEAAYCAAANDEELSYSGNFDLTSNDWAMCGWFRMEEDGDSNHQRIWRLTANGALRGMIRYEDDVNDFYMKFGSATQDPLYANGPAHYPHKWYFVYWQYNAATDKIGIRVNDGDLFERDQEGALPTDADAFAFGAVEESNCDVVIDAVHWWERILTREEINYMYNDGDGRELE